MFKIRNARGLDKVVYKFQLWLALKSVLIARNDNMKSNLPSVKSKPKDTISYQYVTHGKTMWPESNLDKNLFTCILEV